MELSAKTPSSVRRMGPPAPATVVSSVEEISLVQEAFGALNDLAVARDRIPAEARLTSPEIAFAAGRLIGRREQSAAALHAASSRAFARLSRARRFWR